MTTYVRKYTSIELIAWVVVFGIALFFAIVPATWYAQYWRIDDSFYYPIIARNIARGLGSTYDGGITLTNGYHPLWALLHVPLALLSGKTLSATYLQLSDILSVATAVLAIFIWWRVVRHVFIDRIAASIFILLLGSYWWSIDYLYGGLETPLVVLFMGACLLQTQRIASDKSTSLRDAVVLGILMAATFLARLDSVFFLGALSLVLLIYYVRRQAYRPLLVISGTVLILTIPYLLWNWLRFGSPIPVSGIKKTIGLNIADGLAKMSYSFGSKLGEVTHIIPPVILLVFVVVGIVLIAVLRRQIITAFRMWGVLWIMPAAALIHFLYTSFFMSEGAVGWYQYTEYLIVYLVLATLTHAFVLYVNDRDWRRLAYAPFAILLLVIIIQFNFILKDIFRNPDRGAAAVYKTAIWAKENLPADSRIGMYDSGLFHYMSGLKTVSLNGLAGDEELMNLAIENDIRTIIDRYNLDYIVTFTTNPAWSGNYTSLGGDTFESPYIVYRDDTKIERVKHGGFRVGSYVIIDSEFYLDSDDLIFKTGREENQ